MNEEIRKTDITKAVNVSKNDVFVSSDFIAEVFGKRPDNVLRDIENTKVNLLKIEEKTDKYFKDSSYIDSKNRTHKRYNLTRKGFDLIALSFTGEKALKYKVWFIDEFHRKASILTQQQMLIAKNSGSDMWQEIRGKTKESRVALTNAIQKYELPQRISEGKSHEKFVATRIMNYTQLINKVLNIESIPRDALEPRMLFKLEELEYKVADQIKDYTEIKGCHYKQTYQLIKKGLL